MLHVVITNYKNPAISCHKMLQDATRCYRVPQDAVCCDKIATIYNNVQLGNWAYLIFLITCQSRDVLREQPLVASEKQDDLIK